MDVEKLLLGHGEDAPSGEDLEYDPKFMELEITAQPGEERQAGDEILAAEDPDYKEVAAQALGIMERSHDLRAAVFMGEAQLRLTGFPGFAKATSYIAGCLEQYWDTCHPQLDADDDNDPTMRVNAILSLADTNRILRGVRRAPLTASRTFGAISLRDIAAAEGEITPTSDMENVPDPTQVTAAFQDTDPEKLSEIANAAATALRNVEAITAKFDLETPGQGPDLDPLIKMLKQANARLADATGVSMGDTSDDALPEEDGTMESSAAAPRASGGGINNANDVLNAIDRIVSYYERTEPSSPVPLLLLRAKKLVNADFMTIVKDMAPSGIDNVNLISGIEEEY